MDGAQVQQYAQVIIDWGKVPDVAGPLLYKLAALIFGFWASMAAKDYLTQLYKSWKVKRWNAFNEGDKITVDNVHGRVLSIGLTHTKIQKDAYMIGKTKYPESTAYIPTAQLLDKMVIVYKYQEIIKPGKGGNQ